jgi:monoamine oxidase
VRSDTEVAVIGGGAAGIAAARRLHDANIPCLLIEARGRLGGRACTATVGGYRLDLGCGWLHSADRNPWTTVAEQKGLAVDKTPPPWMRPAQTKSMSLTDQLSFWRATEAFFARNADAARDGADIVASASLDPGSRWNPLINAVATYISGAELDRVSGLDFARYEDTDVNWRVVEGYGTAIAAHAQGVDTILDCAVRRIDHSGRRLVVETAKGNVTADRVIVTLPSTIIAETPDLFRPVLPEKTALAAGLPLGLDDKLFMTLTGAEEFDSESRVFGSIKNAATATYHFRPYGRPLIEAYFGGRNAEALEAAGEGAFFDFAVSELTGVFGSSFARRIKPLPMHLWQRDPFARGSYSYAVPGSGDSRAALGRPVDDRIFFAGEACSPGSFSTAHGGYFTGIAAAEAVIAARQK